MNDLIIIGLITIVISVTVPIDTPINILDRLINSFNIRFNLLENGLQYYNYWSNWINVSLILLLFYTLYTISKLFYKWLLFTEIIEVTFNLDLNTIFRNLFDRINKLYAGFKR